MNPVTLLPNDILTSKVEPVAGLDPLYEIVADGGAVSIVNAVSARALAAFPAVLDLG